MRVVGGIWRGRPLVAPFGRATRPTSDKVREAIFDMLQALPELRAPGGGQAPRTAPSSDGSTATTPAGPLAGHVVLDLYAGSGALGIEALSRGAVRCTFVERDRAALSVLRRNLASVGVPVVRGGKDGPGGGGHALAAIDDVSGGGDVSPVARLAATDVRRALQADARAGCMYTLVLADPPYARSADAQDALCHGLGSVLAPQAVIVVETSVREDVVLPWHVVRVKVYGDTKVAVLTAG